MPKNSIGRKIARGQLAIAAFALIFTGVAAFSVHALSRRVIDLYSWTHDELHAVEEIADSIAENRIAEAYVIQSRGRDGDSLLRLRRQGVEDNLRILSQLAAGEPIERDVARIHRAWRLYLRDQWRLRALVRAGRISEAEMAFAGPVEQRFNELDIMTDGLIARIDDIAAAREDDALRLATGTTAIVGVLCLAILLAALVNLLIVRRRISRPLAAITRSLSQLAEGDLSVSVEIGGHGDDEIGRMIAALEIFRANALELEGAHLATREAQAQAEALARHDPLTGLPNRRLFLEAVERVVRTGGPDPVALLMVDLDRFKPVNDVYGHEAGDQLLCELAQRLEALRDACTVARLGGDEFAVLVPVTEGAEDAAHVCETIQQLIAKPFQLGEQRAEISATIGVALYPSDGRETSALLRAADLAMYQAKNVSRGSYRFFESAMQAELECRARFDAEMQRAISEGQIKPYYQPLVSIHGQDLAGFEILARWIHPERGVIPPDEFIPAAEERGLLPELTYKLLRQACSDARHWPAHLRLSINLSPSQLRDPMLAVRMLAILKEARIAPQRIEIEVTENAMVSDLEATKTVLASLQNLGMTIALDDFGTGYSSLYHLRELRFDKIKVDKSFVHALDAGDEKGKIVRAMIGLGKSLGLTTTAEGIEDPGQWSLLADWGCDFGQGFLFGEAMAPVQVDEWLAARAAMDEEASPRAASGGRNG